MPGSGGDPTGPGAPQAAATGPGGSGGRGCEAEFHRAHGRLHHGGAGLSSALIRARRPSTRFRGGGAGGLRPALGGPPIVRPVAGARARRRRGGAERGAEPSRPRVRPDLDSSGRLAVAGILVAILGIWGIRRAPGSPGDAGARLVRLALVIIATALVEVSGFIIKRPVGGVRLGGAVIRAARRKAAHPGAGPHRLRVQTVLVVVGGLDHPDRAGPEGRAHSCASAGCWASRWFRGPDPGEGLPDRPVPDRRGRGLGRRQRADR